MEKSASEPTAVPTPQTEQQSADTRPRLPSGWAERLKQTVQTGGREQAFEELISLLRDSGQFEKILEARLLAKRAELGLPLVHARPLDDLLPEVRQQYEDAYVEACREVGRLLLENGEIARAWPYYRVIGEPGPVAEAIERLPVEGAPEEVVQIAFHEGVNPAKGFAMILENYGTCAAVTAFEGYTGQAGRQECITLLVNRLHEELLSGLKYAIEQREGKCPETDSIEELVADRPWLFEDNTYFVDTSHLSATVRFATESEDRRTIERAVGLCEYGRRLSPMLQYKGFVPFEDVYNDCLVYLRALLGEDPTPAIEMLHRKAQHENADLTGYIAAQVLVNLLCRLKRYEEAIDVFERYLREVPLDQLYCPTLQQLCALAGRPDRLQQAAIRDDDAVAYLAGLLLERSEPGEKPHEQGAADRS